MLIVRVMGYETEPNFEPMLRTVQIEIEQLKTVQVEKCDPFPSEEILPEPNGDH
jgi:hypothetical protein